MAKYREIILKDGRKVFIDNKGNIVESGTFQQPTGENSDTGKQSLASLPVDNNVKPTKVDLLNIDLGDTNKSDGSAVVETPVENTVRRTPATPRRRTASTPVKRTQTSTPAKIVYKRNGSTVTVTAADKNTPSKLPEITVASTRTPKYSTKVDTVKTDSIKTDSIKKDSVKTAEERKQILAKKKINTPKKVELPKHTQRVLNTQSKQGLSGADPVGQFYVESVLGSKIFKSIKSAYQSGKSVANYIANNAELIAKKLTPQVGQNAPRTVQATKQVISNAGKRLKTTTNNPKGAVNNNNVKQQVNSYATRMRNYQQGRINHSDINRSIAKNAERMRLLSGK